MRHRATTGYPRFSKQFGGIVIFIFLAAGAGAAVAAWDLDTDIPAGPPATWTRGMPVLTPVFAPVRTPPRDTARKPGPAVDTMVEPRTPTLTTDARQLRSTDLSEIVTVDVVNHIPWTDPGPHGYGANNPGSGVRDGRPVGEWDRGYWMGLVPLLRVLLHPNQVSRAETAAYLIEVGELALPAVRAARVEPSLSDLCADVQSAVGPEFGSNVRAPEGSSPLEKLNFRFVADELLRASPYDPRGLFGRRIEMFGDEMYPFVAACTQHENPRLARAAVSALALFRSRSVPDRLLQIATTTKDAVIRMRTLTMLTRFPQTEGTVRKLDGLLQQAREKFEIVKIVQTLGDLRDPAAAPGILKIAKKFEGDFDVLPSCIAALGRIGTAGAHGELRDYLKKIYKQAKNHDARWADTTTAGGHVADLPDPPGARWLQIEQLALIGLIRTSPPDADLEGELSGWMARDLAVPERNPRFQNAPSWGRLASRLGGVAPVAQFDYLEALDRSGGSGAQILAEIVNNTGFGISARNYALRLLPPSRQATIAREWLGPESKAELGLQASALDLLDQLDDADILQFTNEFMARHSKQVPSTMSSTRRIAVAIAIRILQSRNTGTETLVEFARFLAPAKAVVEDDLAQWRDAITRIVDLAGSKVAERVVRDAAVEIVDRIYNKVRTAADAASPNWRQDALQFLLQSIRSYRLKLGQSGSREATIETVLQYFSQFRTAGPAGTPSSSVTSDIPLEDIALLALGRSKDPRGLALLRMLLTADGFQHVAATCWALGCGRDRAAAKSIHGFLLDSDPFVRYCAYRALKSITGQDFFADWLQGNMFDMAEAAKKYKQCIGS
jgi:hypothetical protein